MRFLFFLIMLVSACTYPLDECNNYSTNNIYPAYKVNITQTTPSGISVDTSGQDVNLETIDYIFDTVEACLFTHFPDRIPRETMDKAWCYNAWQGKVRPLDRSCISVKIPDTTRVSCDGEMQLLDRNANPDLCRAKGLNRDFKECPCSWRSGIQEGETIVVTPDLHMLPDPIVRYMTSCLMVWADNLATCAQPLMIPLTGELVEK